MNRYKNYALALTFCIPVGANAAVNSYDSKSAYDADLAGSSVVELNFDSMTAGDTIASGSSFGDMSIHYNFGPGIDMTVETGFATTSPANYLGSTGGYFVGGDSITFNFSQNITSFGMYVISESVVYDDDFTISTNFGDSATNNFLAGEIIQSPYTTAYFMGLIESDSSQAFNSVTFTSFNDPTLTFNIDDISYTTVSAVPEPSALLMMLAGSLSVFGLTALRRQRHIKLNN